MTLEHPPGLTGQLFSFSNPIKTSIIHEQQPHLQIYRWGYRLIYLPIHLSINQSITALVFVKPLHSNTVGGGITPGIKHTTKKMTTLCPLPNTLGFRGTCEQHQSPLMIPDQNPQTTKYARSFRAMAPPILSSISPLSATKERKDHCLKPDSVWFLRSTVMNCLLVSSSPCRPAPRISSL